MLFVCVLLVVGLWMCVDRSQVVAVGCLVLGIWCCVRAAGCWLLIVDCLNDGCLPVYVVCWLSGVGCWLFGYLVFGVWLFVV